MESTELRSNDTHCMGKLAFSEVLRTCPTSHGVEYQPSLLTFRLGCIGEFGTNRSPWS